MIAIANTPSLNASIRPVPHRSPTTIIVIPHWTISFGEYRPVIALPPSANTNIATDIGRIVLPVFSASKPSTVCRYSGITKKVPWMMNAWHHCTTSPARILGICGSARSSSGSFPASLTRCSCRMNSHSTTEPIAISHKLGDRPSGETGAASFALTHPHWLVFRTPNTTAPRPAADSTAPPRSSLLLRPTVAGISFRNSIRISITTVSPANT